MSGKVKAVVGVLVVVLAAGGGFYYWKASQASKDTERITSLEEKVQTAESVEQTLSGGQADFNEANKAIKSSGLLPEDKQLELLRKQLDNESSASRMAAVVELMKLHEDKGSAGAGEALQTASDKEKDADVKNAIDAHFAKLELSKAPEGERQGVLVRLAEDKRVGYRLMAAQELAKVDTPEAKELLGKLAKDADEYVQLTAEEALEGGDEVDEE